MGITSLQSDSRPVGGPGGLGALGRGILGE